MLAVSLAARGSSDTHAQRALLPAAVSVVGRDAIARLRRSSDCQTRLAEAVPSAAPGLDLCATVTHDGMMAYRICVAT